jgi:hypothetical protein
VGLNETDTDCYGRRGLEDVKKAFETIKKKDSKWKIPKFKFIRSKRDGVLV